MRKAIFFFLLVAACARTGPADFGPGEFGCEFCRMGIVNMAFKTEIISPKGKVYHFDSIECLVSWAKDHPEEIKSRWVTDFNPPQKWIPFEKAFFLESEKIRSPMGGNLSAYASWEKLEAARQAFGGKEIKADAL